MIDSTGLRRAARLLAALFVAVPLAAAAGEARAAGEAASDWATTEHSEVRLIAAQSAVSDGAAVQLGLEFRLQPGWKIYWRSPGDAGLPPDADWSGSGNLASAEIQWPAPSRFSALGFETWGYEAEVVLPVTATPAAAGETMALKAAVNYLTCKEICIPYFADLSLDLPAGPPQATRHAYAIEKSLAQVPVGPAVAGVSVESVDLVADGAAPYLAVAARTQYAGFIAPDVIVEGSRQYQFDRPEVTISDGGRAASFRLPVVTLEDDAAPLVGQPVTLTLLDNDLAVEVLRTVAAGVAPPLLTGELLTILGFALLGGLILNLMPCVLPVLSLKLLSFVGHAGGPAAPVRRGFLAAAAGILFSFAVLAGAVVAVKAAGMSVGWGWQFQQPAFLVFMILVLLLFSANLFGMFEIRMPAWVSGLATATAGAPGGQVADEDGDHGHESGLAGHFLTGALATLLATPCSAPFLGTAVGFALARGPVEIFAVFLVLGLGLAIPYLLVAAAPVLATRLPKPGRWMVALRRVLAVALLATAVWLGSVLATQVSGTTTAAATDDAWQPFDRGRIAELVASGATVLVDVTADWCLTCQVNKAAVLDQGAVRAALESGDVVAMRADWTKPSDEISRYLAAFGRYGIPFNAVYGPGAPAGIALPELLTSGAVLDAFAKAGNK